MTGSRTMYNNTEYAVYQLLSCRFDTLTCRRIIEIMCDAHCGHFAPSVPILSRKLKVWGYVQPAKGQWCIGPRVRVPTITRTMPRSFDLYIENKWPLNKNPSA